MSLQLVKASSTMDSLERLQDLYQDLAAFSEAKLANIERLWLELEASIEDFRKLLDKSPKNNASRTSLAKGKLEIEAEEYQINEAFQQGALQVADALDIDELEAARLLLEVQLENSPPGQSLLFATITNFHNRRDSLLQCLCLILRESQEHEEDDGQQGRMQDVVLQILDIKNGATRNGSAYARRCITTMDNIESWQTRLTEQAQKAAVLGSSHGPELLAILDFQGASLLKQHEALGSCLCYLFRGNYASLEDLRKLLDVPKRFERIDVRLIHYLPTFHAAFAQYGSTDRSASLDEAQSLHKTITNGGLKSSVLLQPFQAVLRLWWICEYSSWHREGMAATLQRDVDQEAEEVVQLAKVALNDGALTFLLSICTNMANDEWRHPARQEMVTLLLSDGNHSGLEGESPSAPFQLLFVECLESFSESWISNMPDSIRQLKNEEDDRRLQHITAMQQGLGANLQQDFDVRLHLECFLVLISFAFEHRPEAAEAFWADPDGNLYGFLQWASKRQTVPRVSAFCEMLCSISDGEDCAASGHRFLLDEPSPPSSRLRKSPSLNYAQMFAELELYASKVNERTSSSHNGPNIRKVLPTDMNELESPVMLSCYLRLIAHMCKESTAARRFILEHPSFSLAQTVLILCSGPVPTYVRASVFATLEALLVSKTTAVGYWLWGVVDQWGAYGVTALAPNVPKSSQSISSPSQSLQQTLEAIGTSFDQYSALTVLLRLLIAPTVDQDAHNALPFPEDLGSAYRTPGIEPYVDFVCGSLFGKKLQELPDEKLIQVFRFHCLDFMATSLETFNESLVAIANHSRLLNGGDHVGTDYAQRHPFSRVMEWLFNDDVIRGLLGAMYQQFDEMEVLPSDAIEVLSITRCLDIFNVAFELQPTYLEIVRPLVRKSRRYSPVASSAISTLEDIVAGHPKLVSDLARYAGTCHDKIVLSSLTLLQKLSCSTKLNAPIISPGTKQSKPRMLVDMLGLESNADLVSAALASRMHTDIRELENGPHSPGYNIKDGVLAFLNTCLATQNQLPSVAHVFLGFSRVGGTLVMSPNSPLENGRSLCNAIIGLAENYPDGENATFVSWLVHIRTSALQILRQLWTSRLSSATLVAELRRIHFLSSQIAKQTTISSATLWDGRLLSDPEFWLDSSADALAEFLGYRNFLYEYGVTEMRSAMHAKSIFSRSQILATLQGTSTDVIDGTKITHSSIFDLFDFANIDIGRKQELPLLSALPLPDLESCLSTSTDDTNLIYDLQSVEELVRLTLHQSLGKSTSEPSGEEQQMKVEAEIVLAYVRASNRWHLVRMARRQALRMWTELLIVTVQAWPSDTATQTQFLLTAIQLVNPKIDIFLIDEIEEATELLRLAGVLVTSLASISLSTMHGRTSKLAIDRQLQLFRTCIAGIPAPNTTPTLRGLFYGICAQYLRQVEKVSDVIPKARRHCVDFVKTVGLPLMNMLADDAENGEEMCRLPAFVLLALLTDVARHEKSTFVLDTLVKINMLELLVDSLKVIAIDLQVTDPPDRQLQIRILQARLALLLEVSRTRIGAGYLLDSGLFQAVRDSRLCQADPDLGFAVEISVALHTYYELLASVLRLLVSVFLSRGQQNQQSQHQMRNFLAENRANVVAAFKRHRGIGGVVPPGLRVLLEDVVKSYVALISMADFMQFEEPDIHQGITHHKFS